MRYAITDICDLLHILEARARACMFYGLSPHRYTNIQFNAGSEQPNRETLLDRDTMCWFTIVFTVFPAARIDPNPRGIADQHIIDYTTLIEFQLFIMNFSETKEVKQS